MPEKIVQLNGEVINGQIKELVHGNVEETLRLRAPGGGHYRSPVGQQGISLHHQRAE